MPRQPIDPREFTEIDAASWYGVEDVARLFRRSARSVYAWVKSGKLVCTKDAFQSRRLLIQGATILDAARPLLEGVTPVNFETQAARDKRVQAALDRFKKIVESLKRADRMDRRTL